jgi:Tol biopolymer transport system component
VFSPDGRHVAYVTDESGRPEGVVVNFPDAGGKRQLSTDGGTEPVWSRAGDELFYRSGNRVMRVDLASGVANAGIPTTLFEGAYVPGTVTLANYDVSPDASEFLMVRADTTPPLSSLRVTVGALDS